MAILRLTKIDIAEAHIIAAVNLYFRDAQPASAYCLASAAREILTTLGDKTGVETLLHEISTTKGNSLGETIKKAHEFANFFKHADRDPAAVLEFPEDQLETVLFIACHDFARIAGGMPVQAQVYEAFFWAQVFPRIQNAPRRYRQMILNSAQKFQGVRTASREDKRRIGLRVLEEGPRGPHARNGNQATGHFGDRRRQNGRTRLTCYRPRWTQNVAGSTVRAVSTYPL